MLQLCLSGKTATDPVHAVHEKNSYGKPQKTEIGGESHE